MDPDLPGLDPLQRSAESIRYSILSTEFWISPNGQVREWLRHNARLAAWLAIPAFLVIPIVTFVLWQLLKWATMLVSLTGYVVALPILTLIAAATVYLVVQVIKAVFIQK